MEIIEMSMDKLYPRLLQTLLEAYNYESAPRGIKTREILNMHLVLGLPNGVAFHDPNRNLNYRFMLAEWLWIMEGRNDVEFLAQYNARMKDFSDDGKTLKGAYGPKVKDQLPYIIKQLINPDTRQAVLTIWERNPEPSKDIPCTVAVQFLIRNGYLRTIVTMRSSDAWLGIPYDFFTFTMLGQYVAHCLRVKQGPVCFNLGSSHLYENNFLNAERLVNDRKTMPLPLPENYLGLHLYRTILENAKSSADVLFDLFSYGTPDSHLS